MITQGGQNYEELIMKVFILFKFRGVDWRSYIARTIPIGPNITTICSCIIYLIPELVICEYVSSSVRDHV